MSNLIITITAKDIEQECQLVAIKCICCSNIEVVLNSEKVTIRKSAESKKWALSTKGWLCEVCRDSASSAPASENRSGWNHVLNTWTYNNDIDYDSDDSDDE
jgi:hypothetical protein